MAKVFRYMIRDPSSGEEREMPRMATRKFIRAIGGAVIEGSDIEVPGSSIDKNGQAIIAQPEQPR